jgi:hypothetical protein
VQYACGIHAECRVEFAHANGCYDETASLDRLAATRLARQALTPVTSQTGGKRRILTDAAVVDGLIMGKLQAKGGGPVAAERGSEG